MRVLVATGLYPPEIGGPATYAALLEARLPREGGTPTILPFRTVRGYPSVLRHLVYFWHAFRAAKHADLVLALDPVSVGIPARLAAFLRRKPFVVKVVGDFAWEQARQRFGFTGTLEEFQSADVDLIPSIMRLCERFVARTATHVYVPSKYLRGVLGAWGIDDTKLSVVYNGVSIKDVGDKETIRGVLHFSGKLIISVGRLVPWKGFEVLITTFARLKKKDPDLTLFIVGSGPDQGVLEVHARSLGVESSVIFAGAVDHDALLRYLKAADVFVLNTSYEGFSHLIPETMAVGTPVITTMVGGNPEIIDDGVNGYLVSPNDGDALGKRIQKVLSDDTLHRRLVSEAHTKVAQFSDERAVREAAALFKKLCAS